MNEKELQEIEEWLARAKQGKSTFVTVLTKGYIEKLIVEIKRLKEEDEYIYCPNCGRVKND